LAVVGSASTTFLLGDLASQACRLAKMPLREERRGCVLHLTSGLCLCKVPLGELDQEGHALGTRGCVANHRCEVGCHHRLLMQMSYVDLG
jgi:hypothetical protein